VRIFESPQWARRFGLAPAKINLGLAVVGRRSDGYHELESLFVPVECFDGLAVEVLAAETAESDVALLLSGAVDSVPFGPSNLVWRAADAFLREAGFCARLRFHLDKRIPLEAGLGGGSSDAACALRLLNALWPGRLEPRCLRELAFRLGADVPFFLEPRPAWVRGVGEHLEAAADWPSLPLLLVCPAQRLRTAEVYRAFDRSGAALTLSGSGPSLADVFRRAVLTAGDRLHGDGFLHNDLEAVAAESCLEIRSLRQQLLAGGARAVGMSGSGPTLFGIFADRAAAGRAQRRLVLAPGAWSQVTQTVPSPEEG